MTALERFIRYITIPSTSNPKREDITPSSDHQWNMARQLEKDLKEIKHIGEIAINFSKIIDSKVF